MPLPKNKPEVDTSCREIVTFDSVMQVSTNEDAEFLIPIPSLYIMSTLCAQDTFAAICLALSAHSSKVKNKPTFHELDNRLQTHATAFLCSHVQPFRDRGSGMTSWPRQQVHGLRTYCSTVYIRRNARDEAKRSNEHAPVLCTVNQPG
ncbi:hypothetical protein AC579_8852 [Pseudocercospora musae]|uniref:Uncharacterized protein n=1 Tax=Pseudocercospora musae TaxID=113226 RepID=A0A139IGW7_9PEZI|nr:hypothetical protein AC579_8852 [Pseudocercospora musae]